MTKSRASGHVPRNAQNFKTLTKAFRVSIPSCYWWNSMQTSNVTGRHQANSSGLVTERRHYNARHIYENCSRVKPVVFFIVECGIACFLCACTCYVHIRHLGIILTPRLPLCQISFVAPSTAELACRKITYSITHSAHLICREPKLIASE